MPGRRASPAGAAHRRSGRSR